MKKTLTILSLSVGFASGAQAVELPSEVTREIRRTLPKAKVLISTPCRMGDVETYGLLTSGGKGKNPLRPVIFHRKEKGKWRLFEVPASVSNSKGVANNILSGFFGKKGLEEKYQIRCTTPATDVDINTQANGEYSKEFEKIDASTLHLCYQADAVYNSWACLTYDKATDDIKISFVQLNAD